MGLKQIASGSITAALIITVFALAGCGSSSPEAPQVAANSPEVAVNETYDVQWNSGDDAEPLVDELTYANFDLWIEDTDGNSLDESDVSECFLDDVSPSGTLQLEDQVEVIVDCEQKYWDNREGDAWDSFATAYAEGYESGCSDVFDSSPDGSLYVDDYEYSSLDCDYASESDAELSSDIPSEVSDSPSVAGEEAGANDGCMNLFDNVGGMLFYGDTTYDSSECGTSLISGVVPLVDAGAVTGIASFQSRTGNLRCAYDSSGDALTCFAANLGQSVTLDASGAAIQGTKTIEDGRQVLDYGQVWTQSVFTCESSTEGFLCAANVGNYGGYFTISKSGINAHSD